MIQYSQAEALGFQEIILDLVSTNLCEKITKVKQRPDIAHKRWFWELLQNAKDAVKPDEFVSVKLILAKDIFGSVYIEFQHNGNPFRVKDIMNLIYPYSDKDSLGLDFSGKFGTGFLSTHILSDRIQVSGTYLEETDNLFYDFKFTLNRQGNTKKEIRPGIAESFKEYKENRSNPRQYYALNSVFYQTKFRYNLNTEYEAHLKKSVKEIENLLPYVLSFSKKIKKIEIVNDIDGYKIVFKNNPPIKFTNNIRIFEISKQVNEKTDKIEIISCFEDSIEIAVQIIKKNEDFLVFEFPDNQPFIFSPFPSVASQQNELRLPFVVNSSIFIPKEERDGVWLDDTKGSYGKTNQLLFEKTLPLYKDLLFFASVNNWKNTYLLLKNLNLSQAGIADFNTVWFAKFQATLKQYVLAVPLVENKFGKKNKLTDIYFPYEYYWANSERLWRFMDFLFPDAVTRLNEVHLWASVLWPELIYNQVNIITLTRFIGSLKSVAGICVHYNKNKEDVLAMLNNWVAFVCETQKSTILNTCPILPNQHGFFCIIGQICLDRGDIDDALKVVLPKITGHKTDWRGKLLDKSFNKSYFPSNIELGLKEMASCVSENVRDLLKIENLSNEIKDGFSDLINWMSENPQKAELYFSTIKIDTLLYRSMGEEKIKLVTGILQNDRSGILTLEKLNNPDLPQKIALGEKLFAEKCQSESIFQERKKIGDIFENLFYEIAIAEPYLNIQKVDGEQDFIIFNVKTQKEFYLELKSIRSNSPKIQMTPKQASKAAKHIGNYILCVIENNHIGSVDKEYFKFNAKFDNEIGTKLKSKIASAQAFETHDDYGIEIEFEDDFLSQNKKYRYKFNVARHILKNTDFNGFIKILGT